MQKIYDNNGLVFWDQKDIMLRKHFKDYFDLSVKTALLNLNKQWQFYEIESSLLTPQSLINRNYTNDDVWFQQHEDLVLRPETTPGSYAYAEHIMNSKQTNPPFVVYQTGKSFRVEQQQPEKHMRLKEFYQQEFQCFYSSDTFNDYHSNILDDIAQMIKEMTGLPTRIIESDRIPSYSLATMDIEVDNGDKWMEVVSVSKRNDFEKKAIFNKKGKTIEKDLLVLEIAIGLDRVLYNFKKMHENP